MIADRSNSVFGIAKCFESIPFDRAIIVSPDFDDVDRKRSKILIDHPRNVYFVRLSEMKFGCSCRMRIRIMRFVTQVASNLFLPVMKKERRYDRRARSFLRSGTWKPNYLTFLSFELATTICKNKLRLSWTIRYEFSRAPNLLKHPIEREHFCWNIAVYNESNVTKKKQVKLSLSKIRRVLKARL